MPTRVTLGEILSLRLDLPLSRTEAKSRTLPQDLHRLVVSPRDDKCSPNDVVPHLVDCILSWRVPSERIYAIPILPFSNGQDFCEHFRATGERIWKLNGDFLLVVDDKHRLAQIMRDLACEELVFFYGTDDELAKDTVASVASYENNYKSNNAPFFARAASERADGFVFYASTHLSLEVLGTLRFVVERCFQRFAFDLLPGS